MSTTKTRVIHRDSEKGRLVTKEYADKHPKTTEREVVKVPVKPTPQRKK